MRVHGLPAPALTLLLVLTSAAPWLRAQGSPAPASAAGIYTCIDDQGRKITADRPIASCTAKEQRVLNKDGSLKAVFPPILTVEERAEKEAAERKRPKRAPRTPTRCGATATCWRATPARRRTARRARRHWTRCARPSRPANSGCATWQPNASRCWPKPSSMPARPLPPKLRGQLDANDAAVSAQREAAISQQAELERVNRLYDAELARLKLLWAGAVPGSMGPIAAQRVPSPVAASASNLKPSTLR